MRLGLFMMPLHPPTRTLGTFLAETAEKALLAERLGFDEVWLGEHFSATSEPIPSPLMFMASLVLVRLAVSLMESTGAWSSTCTSPVRTRRRARMCIASKARTDDMRSVISTRCSSAPAAWSA